MVRGEFSGGGGGELGLYGLVHVKGNGSLTHTAYTLHLRPSGCNWDGFILSYFYNSWYSRANCCLPLPYFTFLEE